MKNLNIIFTLSSLTAVIVILERLSPTTKYFLQPDNFISIHELFQTVLFLYLSFAF